MEDKGEKEKMIEIVILNRGGQGGVTAAEILCKGLLKQGVESQETPSFSAERTGAPVMGFVRIKNVENEILPNGKITEPDCLVVFDYSLTEQGEKLLGLKKDGILLINSNKNPSYFGDFGQYKIATIDATNIAVELKIGNEISPKINTAMLGAIAKIFNFDMEILCQEIEKRFGKHASKNVEAAKRSYEEVE